MPIQTGLTPITEDIYQVRLPLPFALNHVNCYLVSGDNGWSIIDTGLNKPDSRAVWQTAFDDLNITADDIEQIILTHVHPDHYGTSGWFQQWSGAVVRLSQREREFAEEWWRNPSGSMNPIRRHFERCGLVGHTLEIAMSAFGKMQPMTVPQPDHLDILAYNSTLPIGNRTFQIIHTPGHSDGHIIFYDQADRLLLSGDHVLMKITPNIGLWPVTEPDPLGRYLHSLTALKALDVRLALPGHRQLIEDWQGRLDELLAHHDQRLNHTIEGVGQGARVDQVADYIFDMNGFSAHEIRFAVAETLAHLEYLRDREELRREGDVWWYEVV